MILNYKQKGLLTDLLGGRGESQQKLVAYGVEFKCCLTSDSYYFFDNNES